MSLAQSAGETEKVMQGLYENYLESKVKDPRMEMVNICYELLCLQASIHFYIESGILQKMPINMGQKQVAHIRSIKAA